MHLKEKCARRRRLWSTVAGLFTFLLATQAWAQAWVVFPTEARGVDETTAQTFRDMLVVELTNRTDTLVVASQTACSDQLCAVRETTAMGGSVGVLSQLSALGEEVVVTVTAVDAVEQRVLAADRITVGAVEELDTAAARLAEALVTGQPVDDTVELGMVTSIEAEEPLRREGYGAFSFRMLGLFPIADGYATAGGGFGFNFGFWYEALDWAIEPRIGFGFDVERDDAGSYFEMPIDIGGFWLPLRGDISPIVGGGMGLRYITECRPATLYTGQVITTRQEVILDDSVWGFSTYARLGVLFLRTYSVHLMLTVDYTLTFAELNGFNTPQALNVGLGMTF